MVTKSGISSHSLESAWRIWFLRIISIAKSGRHIFRSFFQEDLERVKEYQETEEYQKVMRKPALWTEPLYGEAKQFDEMRRFRLRRLLKVNIEGVMIAAGQNLKRLIKHNLCMLFLF